MNVRNLELLGAHLKALTKTPGPYEIRHGLRIAVFRKPNDPDKLYTAGGEGVHFIPVPLGQFSVLTAGVFSPYKELHFIAGDFDRMPHVSKGLMYLIVERYVQRVYGLHYLDPEYSMIDHFDWNLLSWQNPHNHWAKVNFVLKNWGLLTTAMVDHMRANPDKYQSKIGLIKNERQI